MEVARNEEELMEKFDFRHRYWISTRDDVRVSRPPWSITRRGLHAVEESRVITQGDICAKNM